MLWVTVSQYLLEQVGVERLRKALKAEESRKNLEQQMVEDVSHQEKGAGRIALILIIL